MPSIMIDNEYGVLTAEILTNSGFEMLYQGFLPELDYVPVVIELTWVNAKMTGRGFGRKLMEEFLSMDIVKSADFIVLEPSAKTIKSFVYVGMSDAQIVETLHKFYGSFGFQPSGRTMWLKIK